MRISAVQMLVQTGDFRGNLERAYQGISEAAYRRSQVIVLPEMWTVGFAYPKLADLANDTFTPALTFLRDVAQESKAWILGSVPVTEGGDLYNSMHFVSPDGELVSSYRKMHLFAPTHEDKFFTPGNEVTAVDIDKCRAGALICFDLRFPELARRLALAGSNVIFVSAQFPHPRAEHWQVLIRARAIENQLFVVACNRTGEGDGLSFFGQSMVVDPWGVVVDALDDRPGVLTVDINLHMVDDVRSRIATYSARRPDIYGNLMGV